MVANRSTVSSRSIPGVKPILSGALALILTLAVPALGAGLASCSSEESTPSNDGGGVDLASKCAGTDGSFLFPSPPPGTPSGKFFNDEGCRSFVDAQQGGLVDESASPRQPSFQMPDEGARVGPGNATFTWTRGAVGMHRWPSVHAWLEREAFAHGDLSGDGYVLLFRSGEREVLRVMTQETTWTADASALQRLAEGGGNLTAQVVWAKFERSEVAKGVPPAASTRRAFTVAP